MRPLLSFKLVAASLVLAAVALTAQAAPPPPADLTVQASRGQLFTLVLDGRPLTSSATRQVHVSWLAPGQHWAEVQVFSPYGPPVGFRTAVWLRPGLDSRYALTTSPYGPGLQPLGAVATGGYAGRGNYGNPGYGAPGGYGGTPYPTYPQGGAYPAPGPQPGGYATPAPAPYTPYGQAPATPDGGYAQPAPGGSYNQPAPGGYGQPAPGGYGQPAPSPYPAPQGGYPNQANGDPNAANSYPNQANGDPNAADPTTLSPLPPTTLRDLTQELREQSSDQARLDVARQALEGSSVQSNELAELLRTLTTEPARVELVELGYEHVSDPANFEQVYALLRPASVAQVQRDLGLQPTY